MQRRLPASNAVADENLNKRCRIMKNICPNCDNKLEIFDWYGICENCKMLIPDSKEKVMNEIENICNLRRDLEYHLWKLEQKKMSFPNQMTAKEKEELAIWIEHNDIYSDFITYMNRFEVKEVRFSIIYPKLYLYVKVADRIKQFYQID